MDQQFSAKHVVLIAFAVSALIAGVSVGITMAIQARPVPVEANLTVDSVQTAPTDTIDTSFANQIELKEFLGSWKSHSIASFNIDLEGHGWSSSPDLRAFSWIEELEGQITCFSKDDSTMSISATILKGKKRDFDRMVVTFNEVSDTLWRTEYYDSTLCTKLSFWNNLPRSEPKLSKASASAKNFAGIWLREWPSAGSKGAIQLATTPMKIRTRGDGSVDTLYPCFPNYPIAAEPFLPLPSQPIDLHISHYWSYNSEYSELQFWDVIDTTSMKVSESPTLSKPIVDLHNRSILFDQSDAESPLWVRYSRKRTPAQAALVPFKELL